MDTTQYHGSFRHKMQRLRTIYTMLERLAQQPIGQDITIHNIIKDIKRVVLQLEERSRS